MAREGVSNLRVSKLTSRGVGDAVDNKNLDPKLVLRRHVIREAMHRWPGQFDPLTVMDCCAGEGVIWRELRKDFAVSGYTPIDLVPRQPGTIRGDSLRLLKTFSLGNYSVIDVDTYGDPWAHWLTMLPLITRPTAVFLTRGFRTGRVGGIVGNTISRDVLTAMSIPTQWPTPPSGPELYNYANEYMLRLGRRYATINAAYKTESHKKTLYFGVLVSPK